MTNPYESLSPAAFWRTAVATVSPLELEDIYRPRFPIDRQTRMATAGSCFAQHLTRQLRPWLSSTGRRACADVDGAA